MNEKVWDLELERKGNQKAILDKKEKLIYINFFSLASFMHAGLTCLILLSIHPSIHPLIHPLRKHFQESIVSQALCFEFRDFVWC